MANYSSVDIELTGNEREKIIDEEIYELYEDRFEELEEQ